MKLTISRLVSIMLAYVLAYFLAFYFGILYGYLSPGSLGGSFISTEAAEWIAGFPLASVFLIVFLLHLIGGRRVWWWIITPLIPIVVFEVVLDPLHIYVPIILGLIAWGLGIVANKTLRKFAPAFMARIS
ncbi:MAG: hypothetical protein A2854_04535 [Parcubacteria group bacterium RIFCSPHIGHO2_01_FULL_56_18]|nr:MAG: hypothetical protein A2854_04535 [Parcubacteria group bacterium RIFCSPHIGHO2_01_FULL_56_18]